MSKLAKDQKHCENCQHFVQCNDGDQLCASPNIVTFATIRNARINENMCGPSGRWFVKK